jgi:hypothetical protein
VPACLQGARALRCLRKLPLLKGLSDNDLIRAASRMPQRVYQDGQPLVQYGERGDELFLIRYGKVQTAGLPPAAVCAVRILTPLASACVHPIIRMPLPAGGGTAARWRRRPRARGGARAWTVCGGARCDQ